MASVTATLRSGDQNIDGLLSDFQWSRSQGPLYFGFPTSGGWSGYPADGESSNGFAPLTAAQQAVVTAIFNDVKRFVSDISLASASASGVAPTSAPLRFGLTDATETGLAYTPYRDETAGDVWVSNNREFYNPLPGTYAYSIFLHEIGHALGLKHPHETDRFGAMPLAHDQMSYTIMSYRSYYDAPIDDGGYTNSDYGFAQTFMMYDIAALQHAYGANFSADGGNTVYRWDPSSGQMTANGVVRLTPAGPQLLMTMWDGGGNDTYDFGDYDTVIKLDLNPGAWTVTSQLAFLGGSNRAPGTIANALLYKGDPRSLIENAKAGSADDELIGNAAANRLDGGGGADLMKGGAGDDTYVVGSAGDRLIEEPGGGTDLVLSSVGFALGAQLENLTLTASAGIGGTGNGLANEIIGNSGENLLRGLAGDDVILGKGDADRLAGGSGADLMKGGGGDDVYIVDNLLDQAIEFAAKGGIDLVESSVAFTLDRYLDDLTLTGGAAIAGTGNGAGNVVTGNRAANPLAGRGGDDFLKGAAGNDILLGGKSDDLLQGGGGNDQLSGGNGRDQLRGGSGADRFVFDQAPGATHADEIFGFDRGSDKIALENAVFRGLPEGKLAAGALAIGTKAADADDRIVYDPATGKLFFDPDGAGGAAASLFAVLDNQPAILAASDFVVI